MHSQRIKNAQHLLHLFSLVELAGKIQAGYLYSYEFNWQNQIWKHPLAKCNLT